MENTAGEGLHHHGVKGLGHPVARIEPVWEEAALPQLWYGQAEVDQLGGEQSLAVAVAVGGALIGAALIASGSNGSGDFSLQQVLEAPAHDLRDQGAIGGALHELAQLGGATIGEGHGLCSVWW